MWMDVMGKEMPFISLLCHLHAVSFMGEALVRFASHARGQVGAFFTSAAGTRAAASTGSARITRYGGKQPQSPGLRVTTGANPELRQWTLKELCNVASRSRSG